MDIVLPQSGWESALRPCGECLQMMSKSSLVLCHPGQQTDCYDCQNRMTVIGLAKEAGSIFDVYSSLGREMEKEYLFVGALFEKSMGNTVETGESWFGGRQDESFEGFKACETQSRSEWIEFEKEAAPQGSGEHVFALIEPGIMGRFVLSSTPV